jgi:hypothetical protein
MYDQECRWQAESLDLDPDDWRCDFNARRCVRKAAPPSQSTPSTPSADRGATFNLTKRIGPGMYPHLRHVDLNDSISTVTVDAGCRVRLFDHGDGTGASGDLVAGSAGPHVFNDTGTWGPSAFVKNKAASMIVVCDKDLPPSPCCRPGEYPNPSTPCLHTTRLPRPPSARAVVHCRPHPSS